MPPTIPINHYPSSRNQQSNQHRMPSFHANVFKACVRIKHCNFLKVCVLSWAFVLLSLSPRWCCHFSRLGPDLAWEELGGSAPGSCTGGRSGESPGSGPESQARAIQTFASKSAISSAKFAPQTGSGDLQTRIPPEHRRRRQEFSPKPEP